MVKKFFLVLIIISLITIIMSACSSENSAEESFAEESFAEESFAEESFAEESFAGLSFDELSIEEQSLYDDNPHVNKELLEVVKNFKINPTSMLYSGGFYWYNCSNSKKIYITGYKASFYDHETSNGEYAGIYTLAIPEKYLSSMVFSGNIERFVPITREQFLEKYLEETGLYPDLGRFAITNADITGYQIFKIHGSCRIIIDDFQIIINPSSDRTMSKFRELGKLNSVSEHEFHGI